MSRTPHLMSNLNAPPPAKTSEFWAWFQANEATIQRAYETGDAAQLDSLLSDRIRTLTGGAGWEIGPYALPRNALVFSPGTRERIAICRELVAAAPGVTGWAFLPAKPPKDLLSLTIEVDGHEVCADHWRYRLTSYNQGEFVDIELFFEECDAPEPADAAEASQLLVEALVGETVSLERVGYIDHSCVPSIGSLDRATPLRFLREHLDHVLAPLQ